MLQMERDFRSFRYIINKISLNIANYAYSEAPCMTLGGHHIGAKNYVIIYLKILPLCPLWGNLGTVNVISYCFKLN